MKKLSQEYLFLIAKNQKLLKNKGAKEILVKYIQLVAFLDTALSGVGIVVTAPTGAGAVISGIAFASSYATLVYRTAKCIK